MKHTPVHPVRLKLLPIVLATSLGLAGCGAESTGDVNGGITGGLGGGVSTNALLLAGGAVGLAAILNSSDSNSSSSPTVDGQGGDADDDAGEGTDNEDGTNTDGDNGSGNGSDTDGDNGSGDGSGNGSGTDGDNGSGDGSGNGSDTDGDNGSGNGSDTDGDNGSGNDSDSDGDNGTDSDQGETGIFQPPTWMNGMWRGTAADGSTVIVYATPTDIGLGGQTSVQSYSQIAGITTQELQSSTSVYQYSVSIPGDNGSTNFTETWTNNNDGSALYTATGDRQAEFTVYRVAATDFLSPPQWLQGYWEGNGFRASVSAGDISYGPTGAALVSLFDVASQPGAVLLVNTSTAADYVVTLITRNDDGSSKAVEYSFGLFDANSVTFASTAIKTAVVMIRQ